MKGGEQVKNTGITSILEHHVHKAESDSTGMDTATSSDRSSGGGGGQTYHDEMAGGIQSADDPGVRSSTQNKHGSVKGTDTPQNQEKESKYDDSEGTEQRQSTAEDKRNGAELTLVDLTPNPGNGEDVSVDVHSNGTLVVSSDPVGEAAEGSVILEITNHLDRNVDVSNQNSRPSGQYQSKNASGDVSKMEGDSNVVKQTGESRRVGSIAATGIRSRSNGRSGQPSARPQSKDTSRTVTADGIKTQRATSRLVNSLSGRENGSIDNDSTPSKSFASPASSFLRNTDTNTSRSLNKGNSMKFERTLWKKKEQIQVHQTAVLSKLSSSASLTRNDSKAVKEEFEDVSLMPTTGFKDSIQNQTTDTQNSTQPNTSLLALIKASNGAVSNNAGKTTETMMIMESTRKEGNSPFCKAAATEKKSRKLLNRSVLKRVASMDNKPSNAFSSHLKKVDLNSSVGSNISADMRSISSDCSDRDQLMQSLSVPSTTLGPVPAEEDEKSSLGSSRKDSVRLSLDSVSRKSVDIRLQHMTQHMPVMGSSDDKPRSVLMHEDSIIRAAIPFMPVRLAVFCLVLNIVLPGAGTVVSGFSVVCCGGTCRVSNKKDNKVMTICLNLLVGVTQLATVVFLLVGWFWSIAWGIKMVILAVEHRTEQRQQREKELQTLALSAFSGTSGNLRRSILPPV